MSGMIIQCRYDELVPVGDLIPYPKNRNSHSPEQIERLAKLLNHHSVRAPVIVSRRSGYIMKGHGTLQAIKKNNWMKAPVVYQDFENDDAEYLFVQSDNAIASWSDLDISSINTDIGDLAPFDIDLLGIKDFTVTAVDQLEPGCNEDEVPEIVDPQTKVGDIYVLGNHRLMCGDSTSIDAVEKLMNGEKADMVFTDPPYGMKLDTDYSAMDKGYTPNRKNHTVKAKSYKAVLGDNDDFDPGIIFGVFEYCSEIFLWGADYYAERILNKNEGSWIVWDKRVTESLDKMFGSAFELCWSKAKHKRDLARITYAGLYGCDEGKSGHKRSHPTQKPIKLAEWFFERWGKTNDKVVDLFGGSGSTLIACEKTNRKCFMMELDPDYCDVIISRWEVYTGKKAILEKEHS